MKNFLRTSARARLFLALCAGVLLLAAMQATGWFHDWEYAVFPPLLALVLLPVPDRLRRASAARYASLAALCLGPVVSFLTVELLDGAHLWDDFDPWQVAMNLVWYALIYIIVRFLLGRNRRAGAAASILCFLIGLANHYVLEFRGRIIFPCDLDPSALTTAANVAENYSYAPDVEIARAAIVLACYLIVLARCPGERARVSPPRWFAAPVMIGYTIYIGVFFGTSFLPACGIYTQQWKTTENGFLLNFTIAMRYSIVEEPDGYSPETVADIAAQYPGAPADKSVQPTNIICIMNESLADFAAFGDALTLTDDPMPFYHSLTENTVKGTLYVPVTGGGTANVEYEFLTGNALAFLPINTVAYQLYLDENAPSLARQAAACGYETTAFHPYKSSGWNRVNAYADLGFENQLYEEDVQNRAVIRQFVSDSCDYEQLYRLTEENDAPQFIFNVTMQNHSGYNLAWTNLERTIELDGDLAGGKYESAAEQFFSLMRASDDAIRELIEYYQNSDEPTLIVMFGDHQPPLSNDFYQDLYGKRLDRRTTEEVMQQYTTPFFIWANYDIEEAEGVEICPPALGALTAELSGLGLTGYQQFLLELDTEFACINPVGYRTKDGVNTEKTAELSTRQQELLSQYKILAYCALFDEEARPESFFYLKE